MSGGPGAAEFDGSVARNPPSSFVNRRLENGTKDDDDDDDDDCAKKAGWPLTVMWIVVVMYLFLSTAVVCDELFVPSLEIISENWGLSDDVSGATLMAAGGSAPELATSLIGTFQRSDVGFGTIVGSAVFNVLFVIGMCVIFTPVRYAPLQLTWWPLFRDCSYYILTLGALAIFFSVSSPGVIVLWEAVVQFSLYVGYVTLMANNDRFEAWVKGKLPEDCTTTTPPVPNPMDSSTTEAKGGEDDESKKGDDFSAGGTALSPGGTRRVTILRRPMGFRTGISRMIMGQSDSFVNSQGAAVVMQLSGNVDETFDKIDRENKGELHTSDLRQLLTMLGSLTGEEDVDVSDAKVEELCKALDENSDGKISKAEFKEWYLSSESRLKAEMRRIFDEFDANKDGSIDIGEVEAYLKELSAGSTTQEEIDAAIKEFTLEVGQEGSQSCSYPEFVHWYEKTMLWTAARADAEEACHSLWESTLDALTHLERATCLGTLAIAPINLLLGLTVKDVRVPGNEKWCYLTFFASIAWIFAFSYGMVIGIETIGVQIGVPTFIMALTFLAAGTSVPDLLSSVVVAKQGKGDMAVSSSIGSNIFDVAVGLPLPWLLFTIIFYPQPVRVGSAGVFLSLAILLLMVLLVITTIAVNKWRMSKALGYTMFLFYFLYLAEEVLRQLPFEC